MLLTDEVQCNGLSNDTYAIIVHQSGTPVFTFNLMMFDALVFRGCECLENVLREN